MINRLVKAAHSNSVKKGFYNKEVDIGTKLCLIHSEVSEALEALRDGKKSISKEVLNEVRNTDENELFIREFNARVKDSFEDELADTVIRVFDLCGSKDIDLETHILLKMRYNSLREPMHGKKF